MTFHLQKAGVLENDDWALKTKRLVFFTPQVSAVILDGKPFQPGGSTEAKFSALKIEGENFRFKTSQPGDLLIHGGKWEIILK